MTEIKSDQNKEVSKLSLLNELAKMVRKQQNGNGKSAVLLALCEMLKFAPEGSREEAFLNLTIIKVSHFLAVDASLSEVSDWLDGQCRNEYINRSRHRVVKIAA